MARILVDDNTPESAAQETPGAPAPKAAAAAPAQKAVSRRTISLSDWDDIVREPDTEEKDKFYVPKSIIPADFVCGWKRASMHGKEDREHMAEVNRKGWRPVPADLDGFAEYFAAFVNPEKGTIEIGGSMLMIRPKKFDEQAKREQQNKAKMAVQDKMREMGMTDNKAMPRHVHNMERTYEAPTPPGGGVRVPD